MAGLNPRWASPRRKAAVLALAVGVTVLHGCIVSLLPDARLGDGAAERMPRRIEVAYVRELAQAAPPAVAPVMVSPPQAARRRAVPRKPPPPQPAASAPEAPEVAVPTLPIEVPDEPVLG